MLDGLYGYMYSNQLHINLTKSVYMHFRPHLNQSERQTCARTRIDESLKLANYKLKRVTEVKFLGVVIDDRLSWEPQIKQLKGKLLSSIVVIKRIRKFIPKDEYLKIYNALFKSHISYCISSWGGVSEYKLKTLFSVQKRCVRLLFGKEITFDHAEYYETCARVKTFKEHRKEKKFQLEHTMNLLSLHHLYIYHTFIDTLKLLKYRIPISIFELFKSSPRDVNIRLLVPRVKLDLTKVNFLIQASCIWNELAPKLMNTCIPNPLGIMVPGSTEGSTEGSDLSTSIAVLKKKLRVVLLNTQKIDPLQEEKNNNSRKKQ